MDNAFFPIELFQRIIDQLSTLHDGGRISESLPLRACSLVCKSFVPLCQWHLFHDIHLGIHSNASVSRARLIGALEANPTLGSFIKRVTYSLYTDEEQKRFHPQCHQAPSIYEDGYSASLHELLPAIHTLCFNWHEHNEDEWNRPTYVNICCKEEIDCKALFNTIIQDFAGSQNITSLEISFFRVSIQDVLVLPALRLFKSSIVDWTLSDTRMQRHIQLPFHLKSLDLSNQGSFPIRILDYCPDIEHLRVGVSPLTGLSCLSLQDVSAIIPNGQQKVATYEKLRTADTSHIIALAYLCNVAITRGIVALPSLDQLTVFFQTWNSGLDEPAALHKVMRHAPNLRSLSLRDINASSSQFFRKTNFDRCFEDCGTKLEHISLTYRNEPALHHGHPASIHMLCDALSYIKTNNQLKTIHLHLSIFEGRADHWMESLVREWGRLDGMLTANGGLDFPHLMKLAIFFKMETGSRMYKTTDAILHGFRSSLQESWARLLSSLHIAFEASILYPETLSWNHEIVLIRRKL